MVQHQIEQQADLGRNVPDHHGDAQVRDEVAGLQVDQVDTESGRVEVRQGKGRKDRVCWLPPSALPAVRDWLAVRGPAPELLLPVRKGGRIEDRALSAQAARDLCRELARLPPPSHSRPTICAGPGPATSSTPAATSRSCSSWPATPARPPPHATIAAPRPPGAGPPSCSTCPTSRPIRR